MLSAGLWHRRGTRSFSVDAPGAGREWSLEMPAGPEGVRFRPVSVLQTFVASAVVVTRLPVLVYAIGDYIYAFTHNGVNATAGATFRTCYQNTGSRNDINTGVAGIHWNCGCLSPEQFLETGHRLGSQTFNLDVGDAYSGIVVVLEEWVYEPPGQFIPAAGDGMGRADWLKLTDTMDRLNKVLETLQAATATP